MTHSASNIILTISCPDAVGIVAAVSGILSFNQAFIHESAQFGDDHSGLFFMRTVFTLTEKSPRLEEFQDKFATLAARFKMKWEMHHAHKRLRVVMLVSKFGHCLNDLLHRHQSGNLPVEIPAVISNHENMRSLVDWHKIPYFCEPDKNKVGALIDQHKPDLVVLARYMQVLPPELCRRLAGKCINIHHSFLPSFKGAKPYAQAHKRGVKLIGATAHYVTDDLDEGPIIDQAVERVDHTYGAEALTAVGRDIENIVLARAVRYHIEHRILINDTKTVVFR